MQRVGRAVVADDVRQLVRTAAVADVLGDGESSDDLDVSRGPSIYLLTQAVAIER